MHSAFEYGGTINKRRAASPLLRLVEVEEWWKAPDDPQVTSRLGWKQANCTATFMVLKATLHRGLVAAVAEWYRYRNMACLVTSLSPVPLKTRRVGQRCTLNLSRAETSSRWCGVVVRRGGASSGVVHVT
ncbi:uncharacterized protein TNCV_3666091 [Trichonephila clavipes]|uniref:Uncharacterized protein n=1 Tax=Trichonephila clavipes TaxID=2585209 RepID=A0A8X6VDA2_TRICX|nr:uncharacterized protein TNCV_3666091 [Trichonephila clavipes]